MYGNYETEVYIQHHSEDLKQQAERERGLLKIKRMQNHKKSNTSFQFGFMRTLEYRFDQIVIKGALK
jgi:hypothetical protein